MTIFFANVVRLSDKLLLASSVDDDSAISSIKKEASAKYAQIGEQSAPRLSFPVSSGSVHFYVSNPIFVSCATDRQFPPEQAYAFMEEIANSFLTEHKDTVPAIERPLYFMPFHTTIELMRKRFIENVKSSSLKKLKNELSDVESSMADNIRTAIVRDDMINEVGGLSDNLGKSSDLFAKSATQLNQQHIWRTYGRPAVVIAIVSAVYILVHFLL